MKQVYFEVYSKEELLKEIDELIKKNLESINLIPPDDSLMTRQQVADYFLVTLPTIHAWMKAGILPYFHIGNKTRFKKSEVLGALIPQKNYRREN